MNTYGYVPVETVMEKVIGLLPLNIEYNISEIVEYCYEAINLLHVRLDPDYFKVTLRLENNRAFIPKDIERIEDVYYGNIPLLRADRYPSRELELYYSTNGEFIYSDLNDVDIEMIVFKYPTDDRGYPLIPGEFVIVQAVVSYVAERYAFKMYLQDKMDSTKYSRFERIRGYNMESAKTYTRLPKTKGDELALEIALGKLITPRGRGRNTYVDNAVRFDELYKLI